MRPSVYLFTLLVVSVTARAAPLQEPAALCEQAIGNAEAIAHTPAGMLGAIGQVESGRADRQAGRVRPWPWTIDADGVGQFFATKAQAVSAVAALQARGVRSIDVGCMQVNLMQHPGAFTSLDQALDPASNMAYAVRFLNVLYRRTGSWPKSIAAYHSETPQIADDYQRRVLATWQQHVGRQPGGLQHGGQQPGGAPATGDPIYVDSGLIYGAFGSTGRVYGLILQGN